MSDPNEPLDLSAWPADEPPSDFAEKVLARVRADADAGAGAGAGAAHAEAPPRARGAAAARAPGRRRRWAFAGGAVATLSLAAALVVGIGSRPPSTGDAIAKERTEVSIGSRARVVLEPGAHVAWDGDVVEQSAGDVFYRVEPGARFRVHTPAGDVEVKGTCFVVRVADMQKRDVKSGAIGAALSALAFVAVYEGKVAVSHAGQRADLAAGEAALSGPDGVHKSSAADAQKAFEANAAAQREDAVFAANENLVAQVSEYKRRLEAIASQKTDLEKKLEATEQRLAATTDGAAGKAKHEFDLDQDDWKELAKDGTIKARTPCQRKPDWQPSAETLANLGLAPHDAQALKRAYQRSNERLWAAIKPVCAQELGSAEVAERIGPDTCQHLVLDMEAKKDRDDQDRVGEAMRFVGEVRAGLRPMPGPNEPIHPVAKIFLAVTSEAKLFEADLAEAFGPEEAHRLAYEKAMCMGHSTWRGNGGKPGPK